MVTLLNRLFSQSSSDSKDAGSVIDAYGKVLEKIGAGREAIINENVLPYSKAIIKTAVLTELRKSAPGKYREVLKSVYVLLSTFQPLSRLECDALEIWNSEITRGRQQALSKEAMVESAQHISLAADDVTRIHSKIETEAKALLKELRDAGF